MWFLSPIMLGGLAALLAPIVLHLWQRRRVVQMPFGSLRFLKKVAARTSRLSRLENLLLLLLRCLIFALLLLAAAKPVLNARAAKLFGGNAPRTIVLIIDNSASMSFRAGERTHLETAKAQAAMIEADLKPGDRVAVLSANDHADLLIAEPTIDRAVAQRIVESVVQTQARSDFSPALREARKIAARAERGVRQVFLLTDNQEASWRFDPAAVFDDTWRKAEIELVVVRPDAFPRPTPGSGRSNGIVHSLGPASRCMGTPPSKTSPRPLSMMFSKLLSTASGPGSARWTSPRETPWTCPSSSPAGCSPATAGRRAR